MPTSPSVIWLMSTLSKLQAQPVVAEQLVLEMSSALPASGGAAGLEITTYGPTPATLIMLNCVVAAVGSSPIVSGCGAAVPEIITPAGASVAASRPPSAEP